jgi:hypothetical protein
VQAGFRRALLVPGFHEPDQLAAGDRIGPPDQRLHGFIGRDAAVGVLDAHQWPPRYQSRESDGARPSGLDLLVYAGGEVYSAVAREPGPRWRIEPARHVRYAGQRPAVLRVRRLYAGDEEDEQC